MESIYMPLQLAPGNLTQPILPNWSFHLFNVYLGTSSNAAVEQEALDKVGSYGKQIGHLAEALEVIVHELGLLAKGSHLPQKKKDVLSVFLADVAKVREIKNAQG